jgi:N-acetylneuraminate synthase
LGAEMIEFHITLDRSMYGSDQSSSIEIGALPRIINYYKALQKAMGNGEWVVYEDEKKIMKKLRKYINE